MMKSLIRYTTFINLYFSIRATLNLLLLIPVLSGTILEYQFSAFQIGSLLFFCFNFNMNQLSDQLVFHLRSLALYR